jgi:hypothetical protein
LEKNKIKIFNGGILDFQRKINTHCFVVGLEILDNLPHDRLYMNNKGQFEKQAMVNMSVDEKGIE